MDIQIARRIRSEIQGIDRNDTQVLRLAGSAFYRKRIGDYRVIVDFQGDDVIVLRMR